MAKSLIYRQNRLFKIDVEQLPKKAKTSAIINSLYIAIYKEFCDAAISEKYNKLSYLQKMEAVNQFAQKWLEDKGFK